MPAVCATHTTCVSHALVQFCYYYRRSAKVPEESRKLLSKWFYDIFIRVAQEQSTVILLQRRHLAPWLLALDEHGGHGDLRGLDCLSVIPYVHRRTELYCAQACLG
jgi:hypothetical protein